MKRHFLPLTVLTIISACLSWIPYSGFCQNRTFIWDNDDLDLAEHAGDGLYYARNDQHKYGYFLISGENVIPYVYDFASHFTGSPARAVVGVGGKFGLIDKSGQTVLPFNYDFVQQVLPDDYSIVQNGGKFGMVDREGKLTVPIIYDYIGPSLSLARTVTAVKDGKWGLIEAGTGKVIIPFEHAILSFLPDAQGCTVSVTTTLQLFDAKGQPLPAGEYQNCKCLPDQYKALQKGGEWGVLDANNKEVLPFQYNDILQMTNGLVGVENSEGMMGVYDILNRKWVVPAEYDFVEEFQDKVLLADVFGESSTFFDFQGNQLFERSFELAYNFEKIQPEGGAAPVYLATAKVNGKWGVIDLTGRQVIPFDIVDNPDEDEGYVKFMPDGRIVARRSTGWGMTDHQGNVLVPFEFISDSEPADSNPFPAVLWEETKYFVLKHAQKGIPGVVDKNGRWAIPLGTYKGISSVIEKDRYTDQHYVPVQDDRSRSGICHIESGNLVVEAAYTQILTGTTNRHLPYRARLVSNHANTTMYVAKDDRVYGTANVNYEDYLERADVFIVSTGESDLLGFGKKYGLMSKTGERLTDIEFDVCIYDYVTGWFYVSKDWKNGFVDRTGKITIPLIYDTEYEEFNGMKFIRENEFGGPYVDLVKGNERHLLDRTGKTVVTNRDFGETSEPHIFLWSFDTSEGLVTWHKEEADQHRTKLLLNGRLYDQLGGSLSADGSKNGTVGKFYDLKEGLLPVRRNGKFGYLDYTGKEAIPFDYDQAGPFKAGAAYVKQDGEYFMINRQGQRIPMENLTLRKLNRGG